VVAKGQNLAVGEHLR